jgi:hypothetical protein
MTRKKRAARCRAIARSGRPCRAAPTDNGLCFFHRYPNKAKELGSIGGRRNRRPSAWTTDALPRLDAGTSAVDSLDWIYDQVRTGAMAPKTATSLVQVITAKERIADKMVIQRQMAEMQDDMRTLKSMIRIRDIEALTSEEALTSQEALNSEGDLNSEYEEPES